MARRLIADGDLIPVTETELGIRTPDPDAVYTLRPITTAVARDVTAKHTRKVPNARTHRLEDVPDQNAINDAFLDHAIASWTGVIADGSPSPCDLAHKLQLPIDVQVAILERAQMGLVTPEAQAASFRESAPVLRVLGG